MTADELRAYLTQHQANFDEKPVQHGIQFRCQSGEIYTVFRTGKLTIQGKRTLLSKAIQEWNETGKAIAPAATGEAGGTAPAAASGPERQVFIVYGHDTVCRNALELLLRRMGLDPIVLQLLPAQGDTIIEKLEQYLGTHGHVGYACVLLTPDDEGFKTGFPQDKKYRARQNVVLELGMVLARLGRRRVAILHKESVELPSDIAGLIYIPFKETPEEAKMKLFQELKAAGYNPKFEAL